ncbi:calcium/sodium antiporter [Patescibacteria group bacterium]|nr:calcium/sodium antiporter [Patescibacteria group bacterium]MBU2158752.1 calcium/sodium antiporter [Patescibacteria group bacterium]
MILSFALLAVGLVILILGAEWLVKGASSIARRYGIPPLVIGLTVVAFGTSMPELSVNIYAALSGATGLAVGNVVGSNIANILLVLGASAIICSLSVKLSTVRWEIPLALLASVLVLVFGSDVLLDGGAANVITRTDGIALLGLFAVFMFYIVALFRSDASPLEEEDESPLPPLRAFLYAIVGLVALTSGGRLLVDQAVSLATGIGLSEAVIGLTVVAIGTSLPELATSVVAAWRKQVDIAVGNVIGSNIFNIFLVLGVSSVITPLPVREGFVVDALVMFVATAFLFVSLFLGKRGHIGRWQGIVFILLYIVYIAYLLL